MSEIGDTVTYKGQRFVCEELLPYTTRDGRYIWLEAWSSGCARCGAPVRFTRPQGSPRFSPTRRCPEHRSRRPVKVVRLGKVEVKPARPAPAPKKATPPNRVKAKRRAKPRAPRPLPPKAAAREAVRKRFAKMSAAEARRRARAEVEATRGLHGVFL